MGSKKRSIIVLAGVLMLLLVLPLAHAKIDIISGFRDTYNMGETITVDGYILAMEAGSGLASVELECPGYSKVNSVSLSLNKGQKATFSSLGVETFILPTDTEGQCDIEASFNGESVKSDSFTILNDLLGSFDVIAEKYRLGDIFSLDGIVFRLNGDDVGGDAKIFFKREGSYAVQFGETTVVAGQLVFSKQLTELEYGSYSVDVKVSDSTGNTQYFENVDSFDLNSLLDVGFTTNAFAYEPGEEVVINGEIDASDDSVDITISFDELQYSTTAQNDAFEYRFFVPKDLMPGEYELQVTAEDSYGNDGTDSLPLTVKQIPVEVDNEVNAAVFNPGEKLLLGVHVLDQAGQAMTLDVHVEITDPAGTQLYNGAVNTAQAVELEFGRYSIPGTYTVVSRLESRDLEDTDRVEVNEVRTLYAKANGQKVLLKNEGNIAYEGRVNIILTSDETGESLYYLVAKDVALEPGEEYLIDLSYDVPPGEYDILVDDSQADLSELNDDALARYVDSQDLVDTVEVEEDNRPVGKRVDHGFSSVTGDVVRTSYDRRVTPWFMLLVLLLMVGLIGIFLFQRREVIKQHYKEYKRNKRRKQEDAHLSEVKYGGEGDIPKEEVEKLLAAGAVVKPVAKKTVNIGTLENKRVASIKAKHVKPGTTSLIIDQKKTAEAKKPVQKPVQPVRNTPLRGAVKTGPTMHKMNQHKTTSIEKKAAPGIHKRPIKSPFEKKPKPKKKNRFSTWNPPATARLDEKQFPAKNAVLHVEDEKKIDDTPEKPVYNDIDEDFLRDEKF